MELPEQSLEIEAKISLTVHYVFEPGSGEVDAAQLECSNEYCASLADFAVYLGPDKKAVEVTHLLSTCDYDRIYLDTLTYASEQYALGPDPDPSPDED